MDGKVMKRWWRLSLEVECDFNRLAFHLAKGILEPRLPQTILERTFQRRAWVAHDEISNLFVINLADERFDCETAAHLGAGIMGQRRLCHWYKLRGFAHALNTSSFFWVVVQFEPWP